MHAIYENYVSNKEMIITYILAFITFDWKWMNNYERMLSEWTILKEWN